MGQNTSQTVAGEWVTFPGGELEGRPPEALCAACREALQRAAAGGGAAPGAERGRRPTRTLCFQCYRAGLERERALRAAGTLQTGSEARFQEQLPFEPVDAGRLAVLKGERVMSRVGSPDSARGMVLASAERFADRRRRAQIAARHALQEIVASRSKFSGSAAWDPAAWDRALAAALHAAELQLPESWMPFVVAR